MPLNTGGAFTGKPSGGRRSQELPATACEPGATPAVVWREDLLSLLWQDAERTLPFSFASIFIHVVPAKMGFCLSYPEPFWVKAAIAKLAFFFFVALHHLHVPLKPSHSPAGSVFPRSLVVANNLHVGVLVCLTDLRGKACIICHQRGDRSPQEASMGVASTQGMACPAMARMTPLGVFQPMQFLGLISPMGQPPMHRPTNSRRKK